MANTPVANNKLIWINVFCVIESTANSNSTPITMRIPSSSFMELKGLGATPNDFSFFVSCGFLSSDIVTSENLIKVTNQPEYKMKALNPKQKRYLRSLAHKLKPVVIIGGAGLTEGVINEINQSIEHHELIKVRINAADRQSRTSMMQTICEATHSALVFSIGHIAVFYRPAQQPVLSLPK